MKRQILKFEEYKINEGLLDKAKDFGKKILRVFGSVANAIKEWITPRKITSGYKKGAMTVNIIDTSKNVIAELDKVYAGTEYVKTGRLKPEVIKESINISDKEIKLYEDQTWKDYPKEDDVFQTPENVDALQMKRLIKLQYASSKKDTAIRATANFFFGAPGIGKTQLVAQVAKELGIGFICFEVANMEVSDFRGLGTPAGYLDDDTLKKRGLENDKDSLVYLRTKDLFPTEETSENGGIIFMDEFVNASEEVIKTLNIFLQSGTIDEYKLPNNWIIVGAGNRPGDQDEIFDFKTNIPAAGRWSFYHFVPKVSDWIDWARDNNMKKLAGEPTQKITKSGKLVDKERTYILPDVLDLVEIYDEIFYNLDSDKNTMAYASPRNWEQFSFSIETACEIENINIDEWYNLDRDFIRDIAIAKVGPEATNILIAYVDIRKYLTKKDIMKIFKDPDNVKLIPGINPKEKNSDPSKIKSLASILLRSLGTYANGDDDLILDGFSNALEYLLKYEAGEPISFVIGYFKKEYPILNKRSGIYKDSKDPQIQKLKNTIAKVNKSLQNINKKFS